MVAMNFPRPVVVLDRELVADTESARRFALGWAFELLVGRYALLPMLGRRHRRELGLLMTQFAEDGPSLQLLSRSVPCLVDPEADRNPIWRLPGK